MKLALVTLVSTGLFVSPGNIKPCKTYAINRPPDKVVKTMQQGHSCWLETSYRINKAGDIIAYSGEWLCK